MSKLSRWTKNTIGGLAILIASATTLNAQNHSISGKITSLEQTTGTPIANAFIDIDSSKYITFTNSNGEYNIQNIPEGTHNIRISAPGYIGTFKQNYNLDANKTLNICLVDTLQESPEGKIPFEIEQLRELPPFEEYKGLVLVNESFQNSQTWKDITEGNLIPIRIINATPLDSLHFFNAIGACNGNGDWKDSPETSIEYNQQRELYKLTNDTEIDGKNKRGILVKFNSNGNYTTRRNDLDNNNYIFAAEINLWTNSEKIQQKEIFGRAWNRADVFDRASYMNGTSAGVTNLDHMLNKVFFNQWAAIARKEQETNILEMENTPEYTTPETPQIINPKNNDTNLEQLTIFKCENKYGTTKGYTWQIATDENFNNIITETTANRIDTTIQLPENSKLYARVKAKGTKENSNYSKTITINTTTGIEEIISSEYKTYPNPCTTEIKIEYTLKKEAKITNRLYNSIGQLQKETTEEQTPGTYNKNINMQKYKPGIYIIQTEIQTKNNTYNKTTKIIKK